MVIISGCFSFWSGSFGSQASDRVPVLVVLIRNPFDDATKFSERALRRS
jgi:hypothetical protein